jgi:hypothetical protein
LRIASNQQLRAEAFWSKAPSSRAACACTLACRPFSTRQRIVFAITLAPAMRMQGEHGFLDETGPGPPGQNQLLLFVRGDERS